MLQVIVWLRPTLSSSKRLDLDKLKSEKVSLRVKLLRKLKKILNKWKPLKNLFLV